MVAPHLNKSSEFLNPSARNHTSHQQLSQAQQHRPRGLGGTEGWCSRQVVFPFHLGNRV